MGSKQVLDAFPTGPSSPPIAANPVQSSKGPDAVILFLPISRLFRTETNHDPPDPHPRHARTDFPGRQSCNGQQDRRRPLQRPRCQGLHRLIDGGKVVDRNLAIALVLRSEGLERSGDLQAAIRDLTRALEVAPGWVDPRKNLARLYERTGQRQLVLETYMTAIAMTNDKAPYYSMRGHYHERQGEFSQAAFDFSHAILIKPDDHHYLTARGRVLLAQNKFDEAIADFDRVFKLTIINPEVSALRGEAHYWKKNYQAALADLNRAIQYKPSLGEAYLNRARVHKALGELDKALSDLDKALEINPKTSRSAQEPLRGPRRAGQGHGRSPRGLRAAIAVDGRRTEHLSNRGMVKLLTSKIDEAIADFTEALAKDPKNHEALQGRGIARLRTGDAGAAQHDFDASERLLPGISQRFERYRSVAR